MTLSLNKIIALTLCLATPIVQADSTTNLACNGEFEGKTIKLIVSHKVGGGYDTYARIFAPNYEKTTGARVMIENWPAGKGRVGMRKILSAKADGLTIGVMDASKRIVDHMLSGGEEPDALEELTILGRFARSQHVLLTGGESGINSMAVLYDMEPRPVFGTKTTRSTGMLATALVSDLLRIEFDTVAGLGGTRKRVLAASRGDVDLISSNYFSINTDIQAGTIRPLMQISSAPISDQPGLQNVPVLGGADGVAARRATALGMDMEKSIERAQAIETLISAGRIFVAPAGLSDHLASCMQQAVLTTLQSPKFLSDIDKANMSIDIASGDQTTLELRESQAEFQQLIPILQQLIGNK